LDSDEKAGEVLAGGLASTTSIGLAEAQTGTSGPNGNTLAPNGPIGLAEAQTDILALAGEEELGEALAGEPGLDRAVGLQEAQTGTSDHFGSKPASNGPIGLAEAQTGPTFVPLRWLLLSLP